MVEGRKRKNYSIPFCEQKGRLTDFSQLQISDGRLRDVSKVRKEFAGVEVRVHTGVAGLYDNSIESPRIVSNSGYGMGRDSGGYKNFRYYFYDLKMVGLFYREVNLH